VPERVSDTLDSLLAAGARLNLSAQARQTLPREEVNGSRDVRARAAAAQTTSGAPNSIFDLCVRVIRPEDRNCLGLTSWRAASNGSEPVRAETVDRFSKFFAPCAFRREAFLPCYGLAASTLLVTGHQGYT
jgi:acyl-CoA synthetase (AMP-forming)/AMP-acid ligase II